MVNNIYDSDKNSQYQKRINFDGSNDNCYIDTHLGSTGSIYTAVTGDKANLNLNLIGNNTSVGLSLNGEGSYLRSVLDGYSVINFYANGDETNRSLNYCYLSSGYEGDNGIGNYNTPLIFFQKGGVKEVNKYGLYFDTQTHKFGYISKNGSKISEVQDFLNVKNGAATKSIINDGNAITEKGVGSVAFGTNNTIDAETAFASGYGGNITGYSGTTLGYNNSVTLDCGLAAGVGNSSKSKYGVALGYSNSVLENSDAGVALGWGSQAGATASLAEGYNSKATGFGSHAEGGSTTASGNYSHAEGAETVAATLYGHASGFKTKTVNDAQFVCGIRNDPKSNTLFEVGNGSFISEVYKNAFEVLNDGRAKVYGTPTEDNDVIRKIDIIKDFTLSRSTLDNDIPIYFQIQATPQYQGGAQTGYTWQNFNVTISSGGFTVPSSIKQYLRVTEDKSITITNDVVTVSVAADFYFDSNNKSSTTISFKMGVVDFAYQGNTYKFPYIQDLTIKIPPYYLVKNLYSYFKSSMTIISRVNGKQTSAIFNTPFQKMSTSLTDTTTYYLNSHIEGSSKVMNTTWVSSVASGGSRPTESVIYESYKVDYQVSSSNIYLGDLNNLLYSPKDIDSLFTISYLNYTYIDILKDLSL